MNRKAVYIYAMKMQNLLFGLLLMGLCSHAQHCPFDGAHLIAIKVVNKQGKMIDPANTVFYLVEVDNPRADSCQHAAGLLTKPMHETAIFMADCDERYGRNGYGQQLKTRLTQAGVFANANRFANLNQAENTCMIIGKSETVYTNYIYLQRKFVIVYKIGDKEGQVPVPNEQIFPLCTATHSLKKFKPVIIML